MKATPTSMIKNKTFFMAYCIGSGFAALTVVLNSLIKILSTVITIAVERQIESPSFIIMYFYILAISIFGMFCGIKIANDSPRAQTYLIWYLAPQIPLISIPGFAYYLKLGMDFTIYGIFDPVFYTFMGTRMNFSIGAFFNLNLDTSSTENMLFVGMNIIPVILLLSLVDVKKKLVSAANS
ncbi:MAG: hypothetical protein EBS18_06275 [Actinobacteria bacterium]|nr:hypothetical protein [Actinomycetota bacterium]